MRQQPSARLMGMLMAFAAMLPAAEAPHRHDSGLTSAEQAPVPLNRPESSTAVAEDHCGYTPGSTVEVTRSTELPKGCVLRKVQFLVTASDVTLNCNNAVLHGLMNQDTPNPYGQAYAATDAPRDIAFLVANDEGRPALSNIIIKNCVVKNYVDGADVILRLSPQTIGTLRTTSDPGPIEDQLRLNAPQNIVFENLWIDFPHKSGLYVNRYASRIVFRNGAVTNSGNPAIYLQSGSTENAVMGSRFTTNGYYNYSLTDRVRNPKTNPVALREAIAVDSSSRNLIQGNSFSGNAGGGVFLYKNCWEHWQQPQEMPRNMHSSDNSILSNAFVDERVGVWIASRQARDLSGFECGDPVQYESSSGPEGRRYYRDYAERATVTANRFENVRHGIRVEDDEAVVTYNSFVGNATQNILVGSFIRGIKVGIGVRGTRVTDNVFSNGVMYPIQNLYGATDGVFANNFKDGAPAPATCSLFLAIPAQNHEGLSCRMEPTDRWGVPSLYSRASGQVLDLSDTSPVGDTTDAWGSGRFSCDNGGWTMLEGSCCLGAQC